MSGAIGDELTSLEEDITDEMIQAYLDGHADACEQLGVDNEVSLVELSNALNVIIAGRDYVQRIRDGSDIELVQRTEVHRMYNTAMDDVAKTVPDAMKTWHTMEDDRVRDMHWFLDGITIPYDDYFYTLDGDYGRFPGDFQTAEENCNCRCYLTLSRF